jgi:hypothetical protein
MSTSSANYLDAKSSAATPAAAHTSNALIHDPSGDFTGVLVPAGESVHALNVMIWVREGFVQQLAVDKCLELLQVRY